MPPLETEENAEKRQKGQGLKIMTPKQLITTLPILLAQLKAGNFTNKLDLRGNKTMSLANLSIYYTWENVK